VVDSCGDAFVLSTQEQSTLSLVVYLESADPVQAQLFFSRFHWWDKHGAEQVALWSWQGATVEFTEQQAEYCFQMELKSTTDGQVTLLEKTCVPHGDQPALGLADRTSEELADLANRCPDPVPGFEQAWCDAHPADCTEDAAPSPEMAGEPEPEDEEGGCSIAAPRQGSSWALLLGTVGVGILLGRRRASRRQAS
jgi:hypothetical protein